MKIIDTKAFENQSFCTIPLGSAFRFVDAETYGTEVYMRVSIVVDKYENSFRAVNLAEGLMIVVPDEEKVILCDAKVVIK